jgi:hypothetical protein
VKNEFRVLGTDKVSFLSKTFYNAVRKRIAKKKDKLFYLVTAVGCCHTDSQRESVS